MGTPRLRARLLGGFDLAVGDRGVPPSAFERPSGLRLLKLLLATPGHRIRREEAAELLWPEADPDRSSASLRKAIHFARRGLASVDPGAGDIVVADGRDCWLDPARLDAIDVDELLRAIAAVERPGAAAAGDAAAALDTLVRLAGSTLLPSDPYEAWLEPLREGLRTRSLEAALMGAAGARAGGDRTRAAALATRALEAEPADERAHRVLIELHLEGGELHAARRQLQACRRAVADAYGLEPDPGIARLIDESGARRAAASDAGEDEPPIVGRRPELGLVEAALDRLEPGDRAAVAVSVLVRGAAGIGKSRLLREMAALAHRAGWPLLELRGLEDGPVRPFGPIGGALGAALGHAVVDDLPEPARSALRFADAASIQPPSVEFASDDAVRRGLLDALAHVGRPSDPITIAVDDAQWLDRPTLDLLAEVILGGSIRRCLVLAAVRDEPALVGGPVSVVLASVDQAAAGANLALGPLAPAEIRTFIERDVANRPLTDDLAAAVAQLSAGMPLFAADLFRSAGETGLVEQRDGRWAFRPGVSALQVPESITRLVDRRIARMGPVARVILATAAELGDVVSFEDLVATDSTSDDVLGAVDGAMGAGLVVEREGRYAFAHPLYRAALRRGLPPRDRVTVHRRIAAALAGGIDPADAGAVARAGLRGIDILAVATHAAAAAELGSRDATGLAVGFGMGAGARQADLFDFGGAVATIERALRIWQRMPEEERTRFGISAAHVRLGQARRRIGDDVGAAAAYVEAMSAARDDAELASAASAASSLPYEHGRYAECFEILDRAGERISDPAACALLDSTRAWILGREGHWNEAVDMLTRAIVALDTGHPTLDLMRALDRLAIAYRDASPANPTAAVPLLERAIHMAVELGKTNERATYEMHLAGVLQTLGRLDEAMLTLDRARGLCRLTGEQYTETVIEWVAAEVEQLRGNPREAIAHRRRELEVFASIGGNPRHEAMAHAHIARLARELNDRELERGETDAALGGARHSGIDGLEARVEWALTTESWFSDMPPIRTVGSRQ